MECWVFKGRNRETKVLVGVKIHQFTQKFRKYSGGDLGSWFCLRECMHPYIPRVFIRSLWNAVSTPRNHKCQSSLSEWTRRPRDRNDGLDRNYTYLLKTNGALKLNRFMVSDHYSESRAVTNWWAVVQWRGMSSQLISRDIIAVVGRTEVHSLCCVGRTVSVAHRISHSQLFVSS